MLEKERFFLFNFDGSEPWFEVSNKHLSFTIIAPHLIIMRQMRRIKYIFYFLIMQLSLYFPIYKWYNYYHNMPESYVRIDIDIF